MEINNATSANTQTNSTASLSRLSENLDNFLTILTTQLQHQDPLSPMDTHEFTNQLVQFANVEQAIQGNKNLESLISLQRTNLMVGAVSYIGKEVEATGQTAKLENGRAEFIYTLPEDAQAAVVTIYDENGMQVLFEKAQTKAGRHTFIWDGKNSKGAAQPDGNYTIRVVATNADSKEITPSYAIRGSVTGVGLEDGKPSLDLNGLAVPLANVVRVIEPEGETS